MRDTTDSLVCNTPHSVYDSPVVRNLFCERWGVVVHLRSTEGGEGGGLSGHRGRKGMYLIVWLREIKCFQVLEEKKCLSL